MMKDDLNMKLTQTSLDRARHGKQQCQYYGRHCYVTQGLNTMVAVSDETIVRAITCGHPHLPSTLHAQPMKGHDL